MRIHADLPEEDYVSSQKVIRIHEDLSEEDNVSSQWVSSHFISYLLLDAKISLRYTNAFFSPSPAHSGAN